MEQNNQSVSPHIAREMVHILRRAINILIHDKFFYENLCYLYINMLSIQVYINRNISSTNYTMP